MAAKKICDFIYIILFLTLVCVQEKISVDLNGSRLADFRTGVRFSLSCQFFELLPLVCDFLVFLYIIQYKYAQNLRKLFFFNFENFFTT